MERCVSTSVTETKGNLSMDILDITKFVLSIFVIAIHAGLASAALNPLLRIAVPIFFMISSYLFFKKVNKGNSGQQNNAALKKFVKRNLQFYAFWFVLLLPVTILVRGYYAQGLFEGVLTFVRDFFLGSTFRASWYLMALMIGVVIVHFVCNRLSIPTVWLFVIAIPLYVLCCLNSNYLGLARQNETLQRLFALYTKYFGTIYNSFPAGLVWVLLGKWLAEHTPSIKNWALNSLVLLSFIALYLEQYLILHNHWLVAANDCYFSLLLLAPSSFAWLLRRNISCRYAPVLRAASSVSYVFHASFITVLGAIASVALHINLSPLVLFISACVACFVLTYCILKLEKQKKLRILRYAH